MAKSMLFVALSHLPSAAIGSTAGFGTGTRWLAVIRGMHRPVYFLQRSVRAGLRDRLVKLEIGLGMGTRSPELQALSKNLAAILEQSATQKVSIFPTRS